ncbi:hypothetical protein PT279_02050 [Bifidobacterium sp. ESL0784]|uniref:hypothetical protein n=1 Tax=Bifidobacterium sp. ESL0784 TaxID=2983231 RepID=UPI0023F8A58E|nr:hypothetical protein [Bifidobacterium sp. ESL0784]MDF7640381.1 hypothetical protein [Bifidobacterium sp. ESL0784]
MTAIQAILVCIIILLTAIAQDSITESINAWPEVAKTRILISISLLVISVATAALSIVMLNLLYALLTNQSKSGILRQLRIICWLSIFLGTYLFTVFIVFWAITRLMHPSIILIVSLVIAVVIFNVIFATAGIHIINQH